MSGKAEDFAEAILTTDTCTKTCVVTESLLRSGDDGGVAMDRGMIHPNMATMLAFITCDANISAQPCKAALSQHVGDDFQPNHGGWRYDQ